ncbi:hypothetical protein ACHAQH_008100 [Verticillium albo-atrum]
MHAPTLSHVLVAAVLAATGVQSFSVGAPGNQLARRMGPVVALAMPAIAMTTAVEEREAEEPAALEARHHRGKKTNAGRGGKKGKAAAGGKKGNAAAGAGGGLAALFGGGNNNKREEMFAETATIEVRHHRGKKTNAGRGGKKGKAAAGGKKGNAAAGAGGGLAALFGGGKNNNKREEVNAEHVELVSRHHRGKKTNAGRGGKKGNAAAGAGGGLAALFGGGKKNNKRAVAFAA